MRKIYNFIHLGASALAEHSFLILLLSFTIGCTPSGSAPSSTQTSSGTSTVGLTLDRETIPNQLTIYEGTNFSVTAMRPDSQLESNLEFDLVYEGTKGETSSDYFTLGTKLIKFMPQEKSVTFTIAPIDDSVIHQTTQWTLKFINANDSVVAKENLKFTLVDNDFANTQINSGSGGAPGVSSNSLTLAGLPSHPSASLALNIAVSGMGFNSYQYKLGPSLSTICGLSQNYSVAIPINSLITDSLTQLSDGWVTVCVRGQLPNGEWQDYLNASSYTWIKDTIAPTATLAGVPSSPSAMTKLNISVLGTGVSEYQYKIGLASLTTCSSAVDYSADIIGSQGIAQDISSLPDGQIKLCVVAKDQAGNYQPYDSATSTIWTKDTTGGSSTPTVTLTSSSALTVGSAFTVTATFSEGVIGLQATDFILVNGTISQLNQGAVPSLYTFQVTPINAGLVQVTLPANKVVNLQGVTNAESNLFERVYDKPPAAYFTGAGGGYSTNNYKPFDAKIVFDEPVTGFEVTDLSPLNASIGNFSGSGTTYTFTLFPTSAVPSTFGVSINANVAQDSLGSGNFASSVFTLNYFPPKKFMTLPIGLPSYTQLPSKNIRAITKDANTNRIYVHTDFSSAYTTDMGASWKSITPRDGKFTNFTHNGLCANGNRVFLAVNSGTIYSKGNSNTFLDSTTGLPNSQSNAVECDGVDRVFIGTPGGLGISSNNGISVNNYTTAQGLVSNSVNSLAYNLSTLYVGTSGGLSITTDFGSTFSNFTTTQGIINNNIRKVRVDSNKIYLATAGGLSISSDGGSSWSNFTTVQGLAHNSLYDVVAMGSVILVATDNGLSVSSDAGVIWNTIQTNQGLISNNTMALLMVNATTWMVGTTGGMSITTDSGLTWSNQTPVNVLPSLSINDVQSVDGEIWVGTPSGVSYSTDGGLNWTTLTTSNGIVNNNVKFVRYDQNKIYLGTGGGISISSNHGATWTNLTTTQGLLANNIQNLAVSGGRIFAATSVGLATSDNDGSSWINYTTANGIVSNNIKSVSVDGTLICLGTAAGVSYSSDSGTTWTQLTTAQGLSHNDVRSVWCRGNRMIVGTFSQLSLTDNFGAKWKFVSTSNGLAWNLVGYVNQIGNTIYATNSGLSVSIDDGLNFKNIDSSFIGNDVLFIGLISGPNAVSLINTDTFAATANGLLKEIP
jgi:photosystem II stability/assembly factor-like uncharacterized protein